MRTNSLYLRRALVLVGVIFAVSVTAAAADPITVQDLRGRSVTLPQPARRLLIDDGRYLVALSLIHKNPVELVAAWPRDINRVGEETYRRLKERFPAIDSVPQVASSAGTFSLERVLDVRPDVAVFTLGLGPSDAQMKQLDAAGIPIVFIDFFSHPFENLERSLLLLGRLVDRETEARTFVDFRRAHMKPIADRVASAGATRPRVFLEAHAGMSAECCNSPGKGNVGDYIAFVGGHNIGADVLPGTFGRLNVEYVIAQDPAVYIATGGPHLEKAGGLVLGPGYVLERARKSLATVAARPTLAQLSAVRAGRVYGLSHQLLNSPLDVLAVEVFAKWIRPDLFSQIDPDATLREINARFLPIPLDGVQWVTLR